MSGADSLKGRSASELQEEIMNLNREQIKLLRAAVFGGMTREEAREYDERHNAIVELLNELARLSRV